MGPDLNFSAADVMPQAVNEGDPEINRQRNLPRGNAAAIEINGVTAGRQSQEWILYTGQTGSMNIYYQP